MKFVSRILINSSMLQISLAYSFTKTDPVYKAYAQKAMELIQNLNVNKTPEIKHTHISNVTKNILFVNPTKQQPIINFLLNALFSRDVDLQLLNGQELQGILKYYPFSKLELNIHIINQMKKKISKGQQIDKQIFDQIYDQCFKEILPYIKKDLQQMKSRSILYKSYGMYLLQQGSQQKGLQTLQHSIIQHKKLIANYGRRLHQIQQKKQDYLKKKSKIFSIKQSIRIQIQSMFQAMIYYYNGQKKPSLSLPQKFQKQAMNFTCDLIKQGMQYKKLIPNIKDTSSYYHRLRRIELQLQYLIAKRKKDTKTVKKIVQIMQDFYQQSLGDLKKASENIIVMKQISMALLKLRIHLVKENGKDDDLLWELSKCKKQIENNLQQQHIKQVMQVVNQFIHKSTQI